jgi:hypothetical protein
VRAERNADLLGGIGGIRTADGEDAARFVVVWGEYGMMVVGVVVCGWCCSVLVKMRILQFQ